MKPEERRRRPTREASRANEALQASEIRYRRLFETAQDGILILDAETGQVMDANPFMQILLGYSIEEFVGRKLWEIAPFKDVTANKTAFAELLVKDCVRYEGMLLETKDSRRIEVEFISNAYLVDGRRVIQVNIRDITERTRVEAENAKLEAQFRQAQKMEAIGHLAGGVAHDFNNLLFVINGRLELLLRRLRADDPSRTELDLVYKAGQRAVVLVRQLLAFSRRQILQPAVLDLNAVVADLNKLLRRLVREDIVLVTVLDPALKPTKADPGQIEQVLMNLVVNARDAMPDGGKLTIETANVQLDASYCRTHAGVEPGPYVMLAVSDNGCGMDEKVKARLFEPFFTTKELGKGTGLGLATVYGIVKQSGGNISVYSELGKGTTFKVYLPRVYDAPSRASRLLEPLILRGTETILLAEDDDEVRSLAHEILAANGYTVLPAANGAEALAACEHSTGKVHLLLTDVVMPGMSGTELGERVRRLYPDLRIIFMSGYADNAVTSNGMLEPGAHFVQKPLAPSALARKVREVLDG